MGLINDSPEHKAIRESVAGIAKRYGPEYFLERAGPLPLFSLGKSYPNFGPIGPGVVTPDELADPDDLELQCMVGGRALQQGRTSQMIFSVSELIAWLSAVCPLLPVDLVFTGTPAGVGMARKPQEFLQPGTTAAVRSPA